MPMFMPDKKKMAAVLVAKIKGDAPAKDVESEEPEMESSKPSKTDASIGLKAATADIIEAIENKDADLLMAALRGFFDMCSAEMEDTPAENVEELK